MSIKALKNKQRQQAAWGTLGLALLVILLWSGSSTLYLLGSLPAPVAFISNMLAAYLGFTVMHEAAHGNIRSQQHLRGTETALGWICGLLLTVPFSVFRRLHLTHHAFTNDPEKDPDYWVAATAPWLIGLRSASIIAGYYYHFAKHFPRAANARERRYQWQSLGGFAFVYLITGLGVYGLGLGPVLILYWGPALAASALLAFAFNWLPHHPHSEQGKYRHTRIFDRVWLTPVLLAQNYHLIHHLHPGLPFYQYPRVYRLLQAELRQAGATILPLVHD